MRLPGEGNVWLLRAWETASHRAHEPALVMEIRLQTPSPGGSAPILEAKRKLGWQLILPKGLAVIIHANSEFLICRVCSYPLVLHTIQHDLCVQEMERDNGFHLEIKVNFRQESSLGNVVCWEMMSSWTERKQRRMDGYAGRGTASDKFLACCRVVSCKKNRALFSRTMKGRETTWNWQNGSQFGLKTAVDTNVLPSCDNFCMCPTCIHLSFKCTYWIPSKIWSVHIGNNTISLQNWNWFS